MKSLQVLHVVVTCLLLAAFVGIAVMAAIGIVEIRFVSVPHPLAQGPEQPGKIGDKVKGRLLVMRGAKPGMEYPIYEGKNVIGRADQQPVDIDVEFQEAQDRIWSSRQHALITWENGSCLIEDLNSANGTYVNRVRVPPGQKQQLRAGDVIQIGELQMKVIL